MGNCSFAGKEANTSLLTGRENTNKEPLFPSGRGCVRDPGNERAEARRVAIADGDLDPKCIQ
jgi:hypothetical protein